jgi:hypothetical protein
MRVVVLALVLCVGCAGTLPPLENGEQQLYPAVPEIEKTVQIAKTAVLGAASLSALVCELEVASSALCTSLKNSWKATQLALWESEKLYDLYRRTGVGLELVRGALDSIELALQSMTQNAETVRSMRDAYRVPSGSTAREVPQPPAASLFWHPNPYRKPVLAQAAQ